MQDFIADQPVSNTLQFNARQIDPLAMLDAVSQSLNAAQQSQQRATYESEMVADATGYYERQNAAKLAQLQRDNQAMIAGWSPPLMYDITTDTKRLVTQVDVDRWEFMAQSFGIMRRAIREASSEMQRFDSMNKIQS